ncbi:MAG TPA: CHRD domain-containing protein [Casimicrobiaceae bacterium]|nr:CHRD domain-containing protein [Casimicrobiaceae bacterium]
MKFNQGSTRVIAVPVAALALALGVALSGAALAEDFHLKLSGAQEVPPVESSGSAQGTITVGDDGAVSGKITVSGFTPTMAHIHEGPPGTVGKVIVPFTKEGDTFVAPPGAKLTPDQMTALKAGNLYFNVHSAAHPVGEVRAVLKP